MISFRPGPVPQGVVVGRPVWPDLRAAAAQHDAALQAAESRPAPPAPGGKAPEASQPDPLVQARLEAARILQEAATEAESAVAEARREGFEAGRQEGLASSSAEVAAQLQAAEQEAERAKAQATLVLEAAEARARAVRAEADAEAHAVLSRARDEAERLVAEARLEQGHQLEAAQNAVVELAVAAAVRLVQGQLAIQPGAIAAMVASGLRRLKDTNCTVRVRPQDLPLLEAQRGVLERELGAGLLAIKPDAGLSVGSYMVESPVGHIDATLEHQSVGLRTALVEALGGQ